MKKNILLMGLILIALLLNAQEVKINNDFVVESDGTTRLDNSATVWDDLRVKLDKGKDAARFTFLEGNSGPQIWFFRDNNGLETMSFSIQIPHTWKEGTTIYPHIHWTPKSDGTGDVKWNLDYTWVNYNSVTPEVFPEEVTTSGIATGPFVARSHLITGLTGGAGIDGTEKKISSILICTIWRNSSDSEDTYDDDAGSLSLDFHFEIDTQGSRSEYIK